LLFLVIGLPWYIAVGYQTDGAWLRGFFIEHNLDRYTRTMEGHRGFPLAPFAIVIAALLPFSVFIIQAVRLALRQRKEQPFLLYCLIVVVTIAGFFSFSKTILPSYPAPAIPFLAVILGYYLHALVEGQQARGALTSFIAHAILCLAIPVAVYIALGQEKPLASLQWTAGLFLVLPVACLLGILFYFRGQRARLVYAWSGGWIVATLLFFYVAFPAVDQKNPATESLPIIESQTDHTFVAYRRFNPAFVFALGRTVPLVDSPQQLENMLGKKILIFSQAKYLDDFKDYPSLKVIYRGRDLFERGETVLLAN
jgi:4-amino-4-deoxy-L-arabinose transferase-like glycosyltransferase